MDNLDYLTIFHEIKNSITLIGSSLQLLEKKHPEVQDFDYWQESMQEIQRLKQMVTKLSASRINRSIHLRSVSVSDFVKEIVNSIRFLSWKDFHCELNLAEPLPEIEIDSLQMHQALLNLLKNSYEAMEHTGTVTLNVFQEEDSIVFVLVDFGGGIPSELEGNIFEPLVTSKKDGSGLGLSITKQIVEAHHGELSYLSRTGDGCTFTIRLPIRQS